VDAINTAATGLRTYNSWLDVTASNIANANDTAPTNGQVYRSESLQVNSAPRASDGVGQGIAPTAVLRGPNGSPVQDASNPMADAQGYVRSADVDMGQQFGNLIMAQRSVEANAVTIQRAKNAYEAVIMMGSP
jgi:flagellar basal-body rod protein FlgC